MKQICDSCGFELYLDLNSLKEFCPVCNEVKPFNNSQSLEICKKLINNCEGKIEIICREISYYKLLSFALELRESHLSEYTDKNLVKFNLNNLIIGTILLKKILEGNHGLNEHKNNKIPIAKLGNALNKLVSLRTYLVSIQENYGNFFWYSNFTKNKGEEFILKNNKYIFIPKTPWLYYLKNLEEYNITSNAIMDNTSDKILKEEKKYSLSSGMGEKVKKELDTKRVYKLMRSIFNGLIYISLDPEMFLFKEIDDDPAIFDFLGHLWQIAKDNVDTTKSSVVSVSIENFLLIAQNYYDPEKLYDMLVSTYYDTKEFPLIIEYYGYLILSPKTIFLVSAFLKYKFNPNNVNNILTGHDFVNEIEEILIDNGYSTKDPKNQNNYLKNRKINTISREFDLIAYNETSILVIECKDQNLWRLNSKKILWNKGKNLRIKDIKKEIDQKHLNRVHFVKTNYEKYFGFNKNYTVEGILVTRIKENIEDYKGIKIICGYELEDYLS